MADIELDTSIHEAGPQAGEVELMTFAVDRARAQFAWKVGGLDADGLRRRLPPSTSSLGGLVKHMAQMEDGMVSRYLTGAPLGPPWDTAGPDEPLWEWAYRTSDDDTPEQLYPLWRDAVARSRAAWADALATGGLDQPSRLILDDGTAVNLRRAMIDTIEEYLRHTGHADLIREAVDGLVGNDPPQSS